MRCEYSTDGRLSHGTTISCFMRVVPLAGTRQMCPCSSESTGRWTFFFGIFFDSAFPVLLACDKWLASKEFMEAIQPFCPIVYIGLSFAQTVPCVFWTSCFLRHPNDDVGDDVSSLYVFSVPAPPPLPPRAGHIGNFWRG